MSKIRSQLEELTQIVQNDNETHQKYLIRLLDESDKVIGDCDDIWNSLSKETQTWMNKGISALKSRKEVSDFPTAENEDEKIEVKTIKKEEKKNEKKLRKMTASKRIPELVCQNIKWSESEIKDQLTKEKLKTKDSNIHVKYVDTHNVLKILRSLGKVKEGV